MFSHQCSIFLTIYIYINLLYIILASLYPIWLPTQLLNRALGFIGGQQTGTINWGVSKITHYWSLIPKNPSTEPKAFSYIQLILNQNSKLISAWALTLGPTMPANQLDQHIRPTLRRPWPSSTWDHTSPWKFPSTWETQNPSKTKLWIKTVASWK